MLSLHNSKVGNLNQQRYLSYCQKVGSGDATKKKRRSINISTLPPTSNACRQHSLRVYHQIQIWRGEDIDAAQYGWQKIEGSFCPIPMTIDPAPSFLAKVVKCGCKTNCTGKCTCVKSAAHCNVYCACDLSLCSNRGKEMQDNSEDDHGETSDEDSCSDLDLDEN